VHLIGVPPGLVAAPALLGSLPAPAPAPKAYRQADPHHHLPYPAGGPYDGIPRIIAQWISAQFGWSIVVDNRTGATGVIGLMAARQAAADGHTLVVVTTAHHGSMPPSNATRPTTPSGISRRSY
jgi:tripartite-type tricarboxylate transporter receptor subunit TctC